MSWAAIAVTTATTISAGFQIAGAKQQAKSLRSQAATQEMEARVAELGIKQTTARRMESLLADLGAIRTKRATQNVAGGGSAMVAEKAYEKEYLQGLRSDILNQRYGLVARRGQADALRTGARAATLSGYAGAVSTIAGGFASYGGGTPKGGGT